MPPAAPGTENAVHTSARDLHARTANNPCVVSIESSGRDPNVVFDWPESDPTLVCLPGTYSGQFNCQMYASGSFPTAPVTGSVSFSLEQSGNGELLQIENGTLLGTAAAAAPIEFSADLVGELDCATDQFRADAMNGLFSDGLLLNGAFGGALEGTLDRANQTLVGTWSLGIPLQPPCVGGFSVVRTP
jgi:hypothetical protein